MSEFNIYKLIEEFINKSNDGINIHNELKLLTPPQSPLIDENDDEDREKVIVIEEIKTEQETNNEVVEYFTIKPNRPYSYYAATNYYPLDQGTPATALINEEKSKTNNLVNELNSTMLASNQSSEKKKKSSKKTKNRLSVSLTDIKKPNNKSTVSLQ